MIIKRFSNTSAGLRRYLEQKIRPRYREHDGAHDEDHLDEVLERALRLAEEVGVDPDKAMTCAYYHDIGLDKGREGHEERSADYLRRDSALLQWFDFEEIEEMAEAVEDHRASLGREPRSLLGKVISDADRVIDPTRTITRSLRYNKETRPRASKRDIIEIVYQYLSRKYGQGGYIVLWIPSRSAIEAQKSFRNLLSNRQEFERVAGEIYDSL